ncbi:glycosyltransferase [Streptomyces sp. NPDC002889]|uniref:glycosyltransferase family 2 protein n=1 Tax=Streptomyces sp. NPDC002889 TaxID=3364669 RepID=UPI0036AB8F32
MPAKSLRNGLQTAATVMVMGAVAAWAAATHSINHVSGLFLGIYYILLTASVLLYMVLAAYPMRSRYKRAAPGRVVAIIPSYNEENIEGLYATVWSLINQSRPVAAVHVVDDGSAVPVVPFDHPLVTWHRQPNGGKRAAQATAIRHIQGHGESFDYVLTVDSDSEVHKDAVWQMLRVMNDKRIQACTGTVLVRNRHDSLLARLSDLNLFIFCVLSRGLRSALGVVNPTSGALSMYRAPVFFDNLDHYLASGKDGDDRQLCDYALMRGRVVSVSRAYVTTDMPDTIKGTYRQRLRWGKSGWRFIPWELTNLPKASLVTRLIEVCTEALLPILYIGLAVNVWRSGSASFLPHAFATAAVFLLAETLFYAILRPGLSRIERLTAPLLVPLYTLMMFFVVYPAKYWSITKIKSDSWHTREPSLTESPQHGRHRARTQATTTAKLLDPYTEQTLETTLTIRVGQ